MSPAVFDYRGELDERDRRTKVMLYVAVDDLEAVERALDGVPVVVPRRTTFYGATETGFREPGGSRSTRDGSREGATPRPHTAGVRLQLTFPPPGFFLNDPRLVVTLDRRTLYDGSFRHGFDVALEVAPGRHVVETAIHLAGSLARKQKIELVLDAANGYRDVPVVHGRLEYSRLTGNFKKRVSLSTR